MAPAQPWRSSAHPYHTLSLSCACRSASAGIAYVTVAGAAIKGNAARPDESESGVTRGVDPSDPTLPARELLSVPKWSKTDTLTDWYLVRALPN